MSAVLGSTSHLPAPSTNPLASKPLINFWQCVPFIFIDFGIDLLHKCVEMLITCVPDDWSCRVVRAEIKAGAEVRDVYLVSEEIVAIQDAL